MKPSEKINHTWDLGRRRVEIVLDNGSVEASAKVNLELSPRPQVILHCEFLSTDAEATNEIHTKQEVNVRLDTGIEVQAAVGNRWTLGGGKISNVLVLKSEPATVLEQSPSLARCKFVLLNFPHVLGKQDVMRYPDRGSTSRWLRYPRFKLMAHPWLIDVWAEGSAGGMHYRLTRRGGSAITHIGAITRVDGQDFIVDDLQRLLTALHLFLSFVRGSYCGLTLLSGQDLNRRRVWEQWGTYKAEPWRGVVKTWTHPMKSHLLSSIFAGFWRSLNNASLKDSVARVVHWYLRSNESAEPEVSVVLTQAALERLAHSTVGPKSNRPEGEWIAQALTDKGINSDIPIDCRELHRMQARHGWAHGPHALVDIRNDLVHADSRRGTLSPDTLLEAQSLGLHYVELMLLRIFGYSGEYANRLKYYGGDSSPIENVPWATANERST